MPQANPGRRAFDLVVFGASSFVGRHVLDCLRRSASSTGLRWAVAGRSEARLKQVMLTAGVDVPVIVADAHDAKACAALASRTRVVASLAGPYALYGDTLVAACVAAGTHWCDISGETPWMRSVIDAHHEAAARNGTRIVHACGFDSVPSDIGVYLLAKAFEAQGTKLAQATSAFSLGGGGINGGTVASLMNVLDSGKKASVQDVFLLNPGGTRPNDLRPHSDTIAPRFDSDFGAWLAPFVMGPINSRVVRRACAMRGEAVVYEETWRAGTGAAAALVAAAWSASSLAGQGVMSLSPARAIAKRFIPQPGSGPSEAALAKGWFRCDLVGYGADGTRLQARVADKLDAGNKATAKMLTECALSVALTGQKLPEAAGVLPPSVAFGDVLVNRLRAAGMQLEVGAKL